MNESKSLASLPKKITEVLDLYDNFIKLKSIFNNLNKISEQPLPPWKRRAIEEAEAQAFTRFFAAQSLFSKKFQKLSKRDKATAIAVRLGK